MKTVVIGFLMLVGAARAAEAHPRGCDDRGPACDDRVPVLERVAFPRRELREVRERVVVGYENRIVGYRDVMVDKQVTEYETRCVYRRVLVGYCCTGPVYETRMVHERVPVCRTIQVCEKQPVYERCPVYEDVVSTRWVEAADPVCPPVGREIRVHGFWGGWGWERY